MNNRPLQLFLTPFALDSRYQITSWLFLKLLALVYAIAFVSLAVQIVGLVGEQGILPVTELLEEVRQRHGYEAWMRLPTLFWLNDSDWFLLLVSWSGCAIALLVFFGKMNRIALIGLFVLYLSLFHAGQTFLSFQWDTLLLESGFLAIFIYRNPSYLMIFLYHWLLFRVRFLSGLSKLISGDPTWSGLTTLNYYFETQPLPHIGAWYAHQLPEWLLKAGTLGVLFMELIVPFFIFLPRPFRIFAAISTILLQLIIIATSNHNFINLLTILLCLFLLDDKILSKFLPQWLLKKTDIQITQITTSIWDIKKWLSGTMAVLLVIISLSQIYWYVFNQPLQPPFRNIAVIGPRFGFGNVYHVFPTMQTERQEYQIEGSYDGETWYAYQFKFKPGPLSQAPRFNVPHQPRLDWMIWFVPPQFAEMNEFFERLMHRLWRNEQSVTALLAHNPFQGMEPPKYLRVLVFRYQFTNVQEREETGNWWKAEYLGVYPNVPRRMP